MYLYQTEAIMTWKSGQSQGKEIRAREEACDLDARQGEEPQPWNDPSNEPRHEPQHEHRTSKQSMDQRKRKEKKNKTLHLPVWINSRARSGASVPEHIVATRSGRLPSRLRTCSNPIFRAFDAMSAKISVSVCRGGRSLARYRPRGIVHPRRSSGISSARALGS